VLEVEVQAGNQSHASHSMPGLIDLLESLPPESRPAFIRGDCDWDNETVGTGKLRKQDLSSVVGPKNAV